MKKLLSTTRNKILAAFVLIEAAIYIAYSIIVGVNGCDGAATITIKFIGVVLCFAVAVADLCLYRKKDAVVLVVALWFTVVSDLFILVLDDLFIARSLYPKQYEIGLMTFLVAHTAYFYRLYADRIKKIWISLTVRLTLCIISVGVMCGLYGFNFLLVEACVYIITLAGNCVDALIICRRSLKNVLFAVGLLLFLGCDIFVGLQNSAMIGLDLSKHMSTISYFIWVFYLPAQVFLALSYSNDGVSSMRVSCADGRETVGDKGDNAGENLREVAGDDTDRNANGNAGENTDGNGGDCGIVGIQLQKNDET